MSEVNKPDGVTVKIPRNALIGGGAVALVGLGLAAGLVLHSPSSTPPASADVSASSPEALASTASQASAAATPMATASAQANTQTAQVIEPVPHKHRHEHEPVHQEAVATPPVEQAAPVTEAPRPVAVCATCGVIESVRAVQQQGQGTGLGAVAGGVLGGVVGNQMGKGGGKTAMTLLGAIGGGFAGNAVEKQTRTVTVYEVRVRMDDGSIRTFTQHTEPAPGTRVTVDGQGFHAMQ